MTGYIKYFQDGALKFCQFRYETVIIPIAKVDRAGDKVLGLLKQVLSFQCSVIFPIEREIIQTSVPRPDVFSRCPFYQYVDMQRNYEQK